MPERDYKPYPTVSPIEQHRAPTHISVPFPDVRFTDAVGRALGELGRGRQALGNATEQVGAAFAHMGKSLEHAGDEIFARATAIKTIQNQTAAVEAETKFRIEADKISDAFEVTQGNSAVGGLDAHMKTLEDLRQKIGDTLSNQQSKQFYEQDSLRALGNFVTRAGKHGAGQGKAALVAAEKAKWDLTINDVFKDPDNPDNEGRKEEARQDFINNTATVLGIKGPVLELELLKRESHYNASQIAGKAKSDPAKAQEWLDERRGRMMAPDIEKVENSIVTNYRRRDPRIIADRLTNDMLQDKTDAEIEKEPGLRERIKAADAELDKHPVLKDDPEARQYLHNQVEGRYNDIMKMRQDARQRNVNVLQRALTGERHPEGKLPKTLDDLRALGDDVYTAYTALKKQSDREAILKTLRQNGKDDYADNEETRFRYGVLLGESETADKLPQFLQRNIIADEKIPMKYRKELYHIQLKKAADGTENPRLNGAMQIMADHLPPSLNPRTYPDAFTHFKGAMLRALIGFQEYEKRPPKPEEILNIGKMLIRDTTEKTGWFGRFKMQFEVPEAERTRILKIEPRATEGDIREYYNKKILTKYYQDIFGPQKRLPWEVNP